MILTRRKLIGGIGLLIAAPAIVRASSIMPVKSLAHLEGQPVVRLTLDDVMRMEADKAVNPPWLVQWGDQTVTGFFDTRFKFGVPPFRNVVTKVGP